MDSVPWGDTGLSASMDLFRTQVQHLVAVLVWALIAGLAAAAGCWCCGYAIRYAWLSAGPPARRPACRSAAGGPPVGEDLPAVVGDVAVAIEAARGIKAIEGFLASIAPDRPRSADPEGWGRPSEA
jgi:hypothetical protein